jgi:hypothetical protein
MTTKKSLDTNDYMRMELHEFSWQVIDDMSFGPLSAVLRKHLQTDLSGDWGGARIFEIQQALAQMGVSVSVTTEYNIHTSSISTIVRMNAEKGETLGVWYAFDKSLDSTENRSEFGQMVGKTALYLLVLLADADRNNENLEYGEYSQRRWNYIKPNQG